MDVYEIIKTIGSGSFGQVYMARHKREGKHYVIKRVKTRDMSQKDLENTENEVSLLSYLSIIPVKGAPPSKNKTFKYCGLQGQLR
jgi:serine/threonine protein kinase